jgi:DNA-binding protein H-NS
MKTDTLNSMSIEELWLLHEEVVVILSSKLSAEKTEIDNKLSRLKAGASSQERLRRPYPPVRPKFRNPKRPSETWAGRGRQPRWLSNQLRTGKKLDEFRIRAS